MVKIQLKNRKVIAPSQRATVVIKNADLSPDRSRFFKETWKEDRRQLFFK